MSTRTKAVLTIAIFSFLSYEILLGSGGILERKTWEKKLDEAKWERERVREEHKNLKERKKLSLNEKTLLEKEARKYYLMRNDAVILKFWEPLPSNSSDEKEKKAFWKQLRESMKSSSDVPPLDVLRVFHISLSIFLTIGVFIQLSPGRKKVLQNDVK